MSLIELFLCNYSHLIQVCCCSAPFPPHSHPSRSASDFLRDRRHLTGRAEQAGHSCIISSLHFSPHITIFMFRSTTAHWLPYYHLPTPGFIVTCSCMYDSIPECSCTACMAPVLEGLGADGWQSFPAQTRSQGEGGVVRPPSTLPIYPVTGTNAASPDATVRLTTLISDLRSSVPASQVSLP